MKYIVAGAYVHLYFPRIPTCCTAQNVFRDERNLCPLFFGGLDCCEQLRVAVLCPELLILCL